MECGLWCNMSGDRSFSIWSIALAGLICLLSAMPAWSEDSGPAIRIFIAKTRGEADAALAAIRGGKPFDQIVRERSIGPERQRGGYLGHVDAEGVSSAIRAALERTRPGQVSPVFQAEGGFAILQVLDAKQEQEALAAEQALRDAREEWRRGTQAGQAGDLEAARQALERAVRMDPTLQDAHFNLGIALWRLGKKDEAIKAMQEATRLRPSDGDAQMRLGNWLYETGRVPEAIERFERVATMEPESPAIWRRLGEAYSAATKYEAAVRAYRRHLELLGRDDLGASAAWLQAALRAKDGPAAVEAAKVYRRVQTGSTGFFAMGEALLLNGDAAGAVRELEMAISLTPASAPGRFSLAAAYANLGKPEQAAEQLIRAIDLSPEPNYYLQLSRLYRHTNRVDLAIVALRDGVDAAATKAPTLQPDMLDELADLYERADMRHQAESARTQAKALRAEKR